MTEHKYSANGKHLEEHGLSKADLVCVAGARAIFWARISETRKVRKGHAPENTQAPATQAKADLEDKQFTVLKQCRLKFDCLIFEMLLFRKLNPQLNTQKDYSRQTFYANMRANTL